MFDLLYVDGIDLRGVKLLDRKRALKELLEDAPEAMTSSRPGSWNA